MIYRKGFTPILIFLISFVILILLVGAVFLFGQPSGKVHGMTFEVTVPKNTPSDEMVWNFLDDSQPAKPSIIPDAEYIKWGDELDYFYVAMDAPISLKDSPTDEELNTGAGEVIDGANKLCPLDFRSGEQN